MIERVSCRGKNLRQPGNAWRIACGFIGLLGLIALSPARAEPPSPPIDVATYNLRLNVASDGANSWPQRRDAVKALIRYHEFDIVGTQEGLPDQIADLDKLSDFVHVGVGRDDGKDAGRPS